MNGSSSAFKLSIGIVKSEISAVGEQALKRSWKFLYPNMGKTSTSVNWRKSVHWMDNKER